MNNLTKLSNIVLSSINEAFGFDDLDEVDRQAIFNEELRKLLYKKFILLAYPELYQLVGERYSWEDNQPIIIGNKLIYMHRDWFFVPISQALKTFMDTYKLTRNIYGFHHNINSIPAKYSELIELLFEKLLIHPLYYPFRNLIVFKNAKLSWEYLQLESYYNGQDDIDYKSMDMLIFDLNYLKTKN